MIRDEKDIEATKKLSTEELLEQARIAMRFTESKHPSKPPDLQFTAAIFQGQNRVMLQFNTEKAAMSLRQSRIGTTFTKQFKFDPSTAAVHQPQGHLVVVENVPVTYPTKDTDELRQIESANNIPKGLITSNR